MLLRLDIKDERWVRAMDAIGMQCGLSGRRPMCGAIGETMRMPHGSPSPSIWRAIPH